MEIREIVEKLGDLGFIRLNRVIGDYYSIYCPFHSDGNEKKASCGILLVDQWKNGQHYQAGWVHCFTCSYTNDLAGAVTDILKARSISQTGLEWLQENIPGFLPNTEFESLLPQGMLGQLTNAFALNYIKARTDKLDKFVDESELEKYRYTVPYMYERKLTDEIIADYDVGVDLDWIPPGRTRKVPCITFPVRDANKNTLFIARRSIQGKLFNYPEGVTKPLYGLDMIPKDAKSVVICESIFNALTAVRYGYNAVALLGTGNAYQIEQLKRLGVREYVIALDGDEAGRRATNKIKRALQDVGMVWVIDMPDGKDVNDTTKEEFDALYENRR